MKQWGQDLERDIAWPWFAIGWDFPPKCEAPEGENNVPKGENRTEKLDAVEFANIWGRWAPLHPCGLHMVFVPLTPKWHPSGLGIAHRALDNQNSCPIVVPSWPGPYHFAQKARGHMGYKWVRWFPLCPWKTHVGPYILLAGVPHNSIYFAIGIFDAR
jgi:hypothetical protein